MEVREKEQKELLVELHLKVQSFLKKKRFEVAGLKAALYKLLNGTGPGQPVQCKPSILGFISVAGKDEIPTAQANMTA